ncbi:hypothetical protein MUP59_07580 [Candidatus Bathyarchaeota archaeon]|nr:hypothetical protein [Candidatus Bathyarchaeota archaeon]
MADCPWKKVLERAKIDLNSWVHVSPQIDHFIFKELKLQPKNYIPIYTERERQRKLCVPLVWPFRNGIGSCVLIRGDMIVKSTYEMKEHGPRTLEENSFSRSTSLKNAENERECLVQGFNSHVFHELLSEPAELFVGSAGKLYLNGEAKYFDPVKLRKVQFELDWSVESKTEILLFEAKLSGGAGQREFVLFQIFYPTAYLRLKVPNKSIRPFFLDIVKRRGYVDYHFMEISYKDAFDLASYNKEPRQSRTIRVTYTRDTENPPRKSGLRGV